MGPIYYSADSLSAVTYDVVEGALSGTEGPDLPLYLQLLGQQPQTCLEVGCGTGRLTFALAARGHHVHGLDLSEAMLDLGRRKLAGLDPEIRARVSLSQGDARGYALGMTFDAVLISFFCLNHLPLTTDWVAALAAARRHLRPGGRIIAHVLGEGFLNQDCSADRLKRERVTIQLGERPEQLEISVATREIDMERGRFRQLNRFRILGVDGVLVRESAEWLEFLWLPPAAIAEAAAEAGLTDIRREPLRMPTAGLTEFYTFRP